MLPVRWKWSRRSATAWRSHNKHNCKCRPAAYLYYIHTIATSSMSDNINTRHRLANRFYALAPWCGVDAREKGRWSHREGATETPSQRARWSHVVRLRIEMIDGCERWAPILRSGWVVVGCMSKWFWQIRFMIQVNMRTTVFSRIRRETNVRFLHHKNKKTSMDHYKYMLAI